MSISKLQHTPYSVVKVLGNAKLYPLAAGYMYGVSVFPLGAVHKGGILS